MTPDRLTPRELRELERRINRRNMWRLATQWAVLFAGVIVYLVVAIAVAKWLASFGELR